MASHGAKNPSSGNKDENIQEMRKQVKINGFILFYCLFKVSQDFVELYANLYILFMICQYFVD